MSNKMDLLNESIEVIIKIEGEEDEEEKSL